MLAKYGRPIGQPPHDNCKSHQDTHQVFGLYRLIVLTSAGVLLWILIIRSLALLVSAFESIYFGGM